MPRRNLTSLELYSQQPILLYYKGFVYALSQSETTKPQLEQCRSYRTKRSINYNDALRPYIVWGGGAASVVYM